MNILNYKIYSKVLFSILITFFIAAQIVSSSELEFGVKPSFQAFQTPHSSFSLQTQTNKLTAADGMTEHEFGRSVAVDGNIAVIGAPLAKAAYIFVRDADGWTQQTKLSPSDEFGYGFGSSVAIDGDRIVIGASAAKIGLNNNQGAVYVFSKQGSDWVQEAKLVASLGDALHAFGSSVDIDGNNLIVGAPFYKDYFSSFRFGIAYIFTHDGNEWKEKTPLYAIDPINQEYFGKSVSISGKTAVVGAPRKDIVGPSYQRGGVYIYEQNETNWVQKLEIIGDRQGHGLGTSVLVDQNTILLGASNSTNGLGQGEVRVYEKIDTNWTLKQILVASDALNYSLFGSSVALGGNKLIVGANQDDLYNGKGSAYIFEKNNSVWTEKAKVYAFDAETKDYFGASVAISNDDYLVGAPHSKVGPNFKQGAVYRFSNPTNAPKLHSASDAGISNTDNLTNSRNPFFDISGVTADATIELLRDGEVVDSAVAEDGTITLNDSSPPAGGRFSYTARQIINNQPSSPSAPLFVTYDTTAPTVTIKRDTNALTNGQPFGFQVNFSDPVTGFEITELSLAGSTANVSAANFQLMHRDNNIYLIYITNILSDGIIKASVPAGVAIDAAGNYNEASTSTDDTITFDRTPPTVTINQPTTQADPTTTLPIIFDVVFSEPVKGLNGHGVISLIGSTANVNFATISVTGSGANYKVAVSNINANGQWVRASVPAGVTQDLAGNSNLTSTSSDNTVTIDNLRPTVTINQTAGQFDPTSSQPVNFTVNFSEPVSGFDSGDISLSGSTANTLSANVTVTGSGSSYNVAINNITSSGVIRAAVIENAAQDMMGHNSFASTSTDNTITINLKRPSFDFDGDSRSDLSVFRPSSGGWYIWQSSSSSFFGTAFGLSDDLIAPADFDGDGKTDIAVFRPSNGTWYLLQSAKGFSGIQFGSPGDIPVPADYDGDGLADIAVFRPSTGGWYRLNSSNDQFVGLQFGIAEDKPTIGDFDGDRKADIAVFRPSTGSWYRLNSSFNQFVAMQFGIAEDKPTPADFDGDGKTDIAVFRPSTGGWYRLNSSNGEFVAVSFGIPEDRPVAADYDGDGKADIAVFRPSGGAWYLLQSTAGFAAAQFGVSQDKPVPNAFVQ